MNRVVLDNGQWFDLDNAQVWEESCTWDGNNQVSDVTGGKFEHEKLYRTAGGKWVLHHWSQWEGSTATWQEIDDVAAARWLVRCEHESPLDVPATVEAFAALELR